MGPINRGIKNAFRNVTRTVAIVFILSVSICLALVMLLSLKTVQKKIETVKGSIGNTVTVSPAGVRGFEGGGDLLTSDNVKAIEKNSHVLSTIQLLNDRLTPETDTTLQASLTPGTFGGRQREQGSGPQGQFNQPGQSRTFTMPITVIGTNCLGNFSALNLSSFSLTSGKNFDINSTENVAIIGKDLATKNNLQVGSSFSAYGSDISVVGIFDGGNTFSNSSVLLPIGTLQKLSNQPGGISSVIVTVDSVDNLVSTKTAIASTLGTAADLTTSQDQVTQIVQPLESIKTISLYSLIGSVVAGAIIIFLVMLMIVRERRREIGVLKAIGGSNFVITIQFMAEALALTLTAAVIGIVGGIYLSNPMLKVLASNTASSALPTPGQGGGMGMRVVGEGIRGTVQSLNAVVGYEVILYGLIAAVAIAVIGSAIPAYLLSKIRPAEVMRAD